MSAEDKINLGLIKLARLRCYEIFSLYSGDAFLAEGASIEEVGAHAAHLDFTASTLLYSRGVWMVVTAQA